MSKPKNSGSNVMEFPEELHRDDGVMGDGLVREAREHIFVALRGNPGATSKVIRKAAGLDGLTKKDVNKCLYRLERLGLAKRDASDSPPTWQLV